MRMLQLLVLMFLAVPAMGDLPPAMTDMPYSQAIEQNDEQGSRLLIVKFTAVWCGPCKMMDRTTWSDENTVQYLKDNHITVISVDVDQQPEISAQNTIQAMPTMVVFKGGQEFDRQVGAMNSEKLVDWLDDLREGRTHTQAKEEQMRDRRQNRDQLSMTDRLAFARDLTSAGELDEATGEYLWLWHNMLDHEPSMSGVRGSFMIGDMKKLAQRHPPAREAFIKLRDDLAAQLKEGDRSRMNLRDWLFLNTRLLDDDQVVTDWIERIKDSPTATETIRSMGHELQDWLVEHGYWRLAGESQRSASTIISREKQMRAMSGDRMYADLDEELVKQIKASELQMDIQKYSNIHAAFLAADRDEDAWQLLDWMLEEYPKDLLSKTVSNAVQLAGVKSDRHNELLGSE